MLLVKRGKDPNLGMWGFPGGLIEVGENVGAAAIRELAEETGITASAGPVIEVLDSVTRDADGTVRYHFLLVAVACRWEAGQARAGDDAAEVGWFTPAELDQMPCVPELARLARVVTAI